MMNTMLRWNHLVAIVCRHQMRAGESGPNTPSDLPTSCGRSGKVVSGGARSGAEQAVWRRVMRWRGGQQTSADSPAPADHHVSRASQAWRRHPPRCRRRWSPAGCPPVAPSVVGRAPERVANDMPCSTRSPTRRASSQALRNWCVHVVLIRATCTLAKNEGS